MSVSFILPLFCNIDRSQATCSNLSIWKRPVLPGLHRGQDLPRAQIRFNQAHARLRFASPRRLFSGVPLTIECHGHPEIAAHENAGNVAIEHQNVPMEHQGLHNFLYDNEDAHEAKSWNEMPSGSSDTFDDGTRIVAADDWLQLHINSRVAGVYGVYNSSGDLQFVGVSRHIERSVRKHITDVPHLVASVRVQTFRDQRKEVLDSVAQSWIDENGTVPPGNGDEKHLWDAQSAAVKRVMTEAEMLAYEENKLKLRKAMGEKLYEDQVSEDEAARRENFMASVENDDWSEVIDRQVSQNVRSLQAPAAAELPVAAIAAVAAPEAIVSPFASNGQASSSLPRGPLPLVAENVEKVLDEVRPFLIADGGNVSLRGIFDGVVSLKLEGACGSCPSSTVTMRQGIETALRDRFPDLRAVVQASALEADHFVAPVVTPAQCNEALDQFRPAIQHIGGVVEVVSVLGYDVTLHYTGPDDFRTPIKEALMEKVPEIRTVEFV